MSKKQKLLYFETLPNQRRKRGIRNHWRIRENKLKTTKLTHKGFTGSGEMSLEDECLIGRIQFIDDIISYEGATVAELVENFRVAVDHYLDYCKRTGKPANKPYSGTFNVRIGPQLHREAVVAANAASVNLNEFVSTAIQMAVKNVPEPAVVHHHFVTVQPMPNSTSAWTGMTSGSKKLEPISARITH